MSSMIDSPDLALMQKLCLVTNLTLGALKVMAQALVGQCPPWWSRSATHGLTLQGWMMLRKHAFSIPHLQKGAYLETL